MIIRSSDEKINDKPYFNLMYKLLGNTNVIKTCYEYFKTIRNMDKFGDLKIPLTEHHMNLKKLSTSPIEQWLEALTLQNSDKKEIEILGTDACNMFKLWCEDNKLNYDIDANKLGVRITNMKISGIEKGRKITKGWTKLYNIEKLKNHFNLTCKTE